MKKFAFLLFTFFVLAEGYAQVVLTYRNNAPLPGDSIVTHEIELFSPGTAGPGQVWDLSGIQYTGEKNISVIASATKSSGNTAGWHDYNTILNDKGNEYFYKIDENHSEIVGLNSKELSLSLSDPILKMSYPLSFGKSITDEFSGKGLNKYKSEIAISGDYNLEADAYGTLILPDRIIKDVLRIKIVERKIQINPCNIYEIKTTIYSWYAPAARYPLLSHTTREVKNSGQEPEVTQSAIINKQMCQTGILLAGSYQENADALASLILFPNPFIETLYYNYFLRQRLPVTIELVDMTGKTVVSITKAQIQDEGFHTGELDAVKNNLKMGIYYFRFIAGDKVLVSKVVKM